MTKSFISDKINSKPQFKASNFGAFIYSVKTQFICCIFSLDSLRSFTSLQLLLAWLWSLVLREKVKQHPKVLREIATAPHAIISRYQRSLPTLLGIHQPLLVRRALQKSFGCSGVPKMITLTYWTCCRGNYTTSVALPGGCS